MQYLASLSAVFWYQKGSNTVRRTYCLHSSKTEILPAFESLVEKLPMHTGENGLPDFILHVHNLVFGPIGYMYIDKW
jgi:hypothetical protein